MIRVHTASVAKAGGCNGCDDNTVQSVRVISISRPYGSGGTEVRLCVACANELRPQIR